MSDRGAHIGSRPRSVLHVLPHRGGGGETYVNSLADIDGYRADRFFLASSAGVRDSIGPILRSPGALAREVRRHDVVHVHGEVAGAISLLLLARRPSVLTLHGLHLLRRVDGAAAAAAQVNLRLLTRAATRTICVSEAERAEVLSVVSARMAPRVIVIHNGVAVTAPPRAEEREAARFEFGISDSSIVAAFVGSLDDRKSPLTAVRAAIEVARGGIPIVLLVAGDGPLRPDVERAAEEERDVVRAIGFRSDPERVLAACDFFVLPSSREGLPYSLLEAMAIGVPAVVSDTPGNLEALGDTGIVAPHGNVAAFAAGIRELAVNITRRRSLGDAARRRVLERFGLDEMLRRTRQAYEEVLDERTARRRLP